MFFPPAEAPATGTASAAVSGAPHWLAASPLGWNWKPVAVSSARETLQRLVAGAGWLVIWLLALGVQPLKSPTTARLVKTGSGNGAPPAHSRENSSVASLNVMR